MDDRIDDYDDLGTYVSLHDIKRSLAMHRAPFPRKPKEEAHAGGFFEVLFETLLRSLFEAASRGAFTAFSTSTATVSAAVSERRGDLRRCYKL